MVRLLIAVISLLVFCAGCSVPLPPGGRVPPLPVHHFSAYALKASWQAERVGNDIRISGMARSRLSYSLQDLTLTARLVDEEGNVIDSATYAGFPPYLSPGNTAPFQLEFEAPQRTPVKAVRFSYVYWVSRSGPSLRVYEGVPPRFGVFSSHL